MGYIGAGVTRFNTADELTVTGDAQIDGTTLVVDSTNNRVGLGTSSPSYALDVQDAAATRHLRVFRNASGTSAIMVQNADTGSGSNDGLQLSVLNGGDAQIANLENTNLRFLTNSSEAMRIDSSGNLFLGKTSAGLSNVGFQVLPSGVVGITRSGSNPLDLNRLSSDGNLIELNKDGSTVGSIGVINSDRLYIGTPDGSQCAIRFDGDTQDILPSNASGSALDNAISLGDSGTRFKDLYLSGTAYVDTAVEIHAGNSLKMQNVAGNGFATIQNAGAGTNTDLSFNTAGSERMRIDSNGFVGIGLTTPRQLLHVNQTTASSDSIIRITNSNTPSTGGHRVEFADGTGTTEGSTVFRYGFIAGERSGGSNDGHLIFGTKPDNSSSPTERMRIDSSGRVMIGTTTEGAANEAEELTIAGTGGVGMTIRSTDSGTSRIYFSDGTSGTPEYAGYQIYNHSSNAMIFGTNAQERMRIDSTGNLLVNTTGSMDLGFGAQQLSVRTTGGTSPAIFGATNSATSTVLIYNSSTSASMNLCDLRVGRSNNTAFNFFEMRSNSAVSNDSEFRFKGDGNAQADGSFSGGGADYAEYFEWKDGNTDNEDRRGYTVVLDGHQIRKSTSDDNASTIIGVVSGNPSMVGDSDINQWKHKYQRDNYGTYIRDENGDRILNSAYDESQEYVSRENRQEWDTVGLMGKLRIRKNQPTGSNWIKMRDVSETVEEWLVR